MANDHRVKFNNYQFILYYESSRRGWCLEYPGYGVLVRYPNKEKSYTHLDDIINKFRESKYAGIHIKEFLIKLGYEITKI